MFIIPTCWSINEHTHKKKMANSSRNKTNKRVKDSLRNRLQSQFWVMGIEAVTSLMRAFTPKEMNFRKHKNSWRWRLEFKIRESEGTVPRGCSFPLFPYHRPCSHDCLDCVESEVQNNYLLFFKIAGLALVPSCFRPSPWSSYFTGIASLCDLQSLILGTPRSPSQNIIVVVMFCHEPWPETYHRNACLL